MNNELSKVKVNNELDFCSVTDVEVKSVIEKALMKARVSYFLRWEKPGFFARLFTSAKTRIVFCINSAQIEIAESVVSELTDYEKDIKMLQGKSNNKIGF
ncbi:MAG: hypothetical protein IIW54_06345 [Lachnospiraceae bacterium]|nr:hypothetical protein [Lachnospiraceae bacterium]MBQ2407131.1 hypothetical protein [Lachnospiraceae bacterium]MBQ5850416.1 hypothetical protein [Lachnospiraceae bacterium]MEE0920161.1 hypothetical protein [Lachnospiraceae bacterium]